jgi:hypothetical protein
MPPLYRRIALVAVFLPLSALASVLPGSCAALASQLVAHAPITLFRGPGGGFRPTGTLAANSELNVLWCTGDATWCLVQGDEAEGWAPSASLTSRNAATSAAGGDATSSAAAGNPDGVAAKSTSAALGASGLAAGAINSTAAAAGVSGSAAGAAVKSAAP